MSIYGALFSGVSGLSAQAQAMGMLSDNITNVNTVGYKETTARFSTLVTSSATATAYAPGGVRSTPQQLIDKQGLLTSSVSPTDLAVNGAGFMVVTDTATPGSDAREYLTRAGSFTPDVNGYLRNAGGYFLRAYEIDDTGAMDTTLSTVNVANFPPTLRVTENVGFQANLKASQDVSVAAAGRSTAEFDVSDANIALNGLASFDIVIGGVTLGAPLDVSAETTGTGLAAAIEAALQAAEGNTNITVTWANDVLTISDLLGRSISGETLTDASTAAFDAAPVVTVSTYAPGSSTTNMASGTTTPDFSRSVEIYDSLGTPRTLTYAFLRSPVANQWYTEVFVEPASLTTGVVDGQVLRGVLAFNTNGTWDATNTRLYAGDTSDTLLTPTGGDYVVDVPFDTGTLGIDAQTITFDWGTDGEADGMTQYDGESTLVSTAVDGAQVGQLAAISIDENGILTAIFENGITQDKYQIPIGLVPNANGLGAHSGNVFIQTAASGDLTKRTPGSNGAGLFAPSSLEASTVDLATEFSKMIMAQRAFSAAAKIITTADEMLDELLRTKR
jgi:flagellar hook protein FlgE